MLPTRFAPHRLGSPTAPVVVEAWLDYVCPFSVRFFNRMVQDVMPWCEAEHPNQVQFIFRHQIQPWHPQSTLVHEAALAALKLKPDSFYPFSQVLCDHFLDHCDDVTYDKSRNDLYAHFATLASGVGISTSDFLALLARKEVEGQHNTGNSVTDDVKYFVKLGRQTGIHVSPTVLIDGIIDNGVSSGWTLEQWQEKLRPLIQ